MDGKENKVEYYTVAKLRELLSGLDDNTPVVAAPINDNIRVALNVNVMTGALGDYKGDVLVFETGLFDIATNKEIILAPKVESNEQGNN